jgi:type I restriction enzyme, S subunit
MSSNQKVRVAERALVLMGQSPPSSACSEVGDGLPFIQGNAEFGIRHPVPRLRCSVPTRIAEAGDLLLSVRAPVGEVNQATTRTVIGRGLSALRFSADDQNFAWHALKWSTAGLNKLAQGSTFVAVSRRDVEKLEIPWHGEANQRIAAVLDTVDEAIAKTEAVTAKLKRVRVGWLQDLLTRGLDENDQLRDPIAHPEQFQDSPPLGWIPKDWDAKLIDDVADVTKLAGFEFTNIIRYSDAGEIIALRALNIKNERLDLSDIQRIPKSASDNLPRSKIFAGDILITYIGAYIGDVLLITESDRFHLAPNIAKVTVRNGTSPEFLQWQLRSARTRKQIRQLITTTATPSLTMTQIRKLRVGIPRNIEEERNICGRISHVDNAIRAEEMLRDKASLLKSGLMNDLLTGRVRVPETTTVEAA